MTLIVLYYILYFTLVIISLYISSDTHKSVQYSIFYNPFPEINLIPF